MTFTVTQAMEAASRRKVKTLRELQRERHDRHMMLLDRNLHIQGGKATPTITMVISDWYRDEFGNRCRTVRGG